MSDRPIRLLLIEDDEDDRVLARELLRRVKASYQLDCAATAAEGRAAIGRREHDVYLVDYRLGEANGIDLVREAIAGGARAPFVMLTGLGDEELAVAAIEAGAADYLVKGEITPSSLHRAIRYALERARSAESRRVIEEQSRELRERDQFISAVAHELRNPLGALQLSIEMLGRSFAPELSERGRGRVERAKTQVERLAELVSRMLDISRLRAGTLSVRLEETDIAAVARAVVAERASEAGRVGSSIAIEAPDRLVGWSDRARLEQIVANLVSNAIKFGQGKPIGVTVASEGERVAISVVDRGAGIDPAEREKLFERFQRVSSLRHAGGLGVGLWIAHDIVKALEGSIDVQSERAILRAPGSAGTATSGRTASRSSASRSGRRAASACGSPTTTRASSPSSSRRARSTRSRTTRGGSGSTRSRR